MSSQPDLAHELPQLSASEVLRVLYKDRMVSGGVFRVGGAISAPQAVSTPDPEYTEEARLAKAQGTCILWLVVDEKGRPRNVRVARGLGYGLDAKAIQAVQQWRFQPALKDGKPVNVQISVEVGFHLY